MESGVKITVIEHQNEIAMVAELADEVWHEHYSGLIPDGQIDYMVEQFQSREAITHAILRQNYTYYAIWDDDRMVGYCAVQPQNDDSLFLSKLYLHKDYRGRRITRLVMAMLRERCITEGVKSIWLTVNKENENSIEAYKKLGFEVEREAVTDIGQGYVMDDYIMRCFTS